jgi:hypothetical protein
MIKLTKQRLMEMAGLYLQEKASEGAFNAIAIVDNFFQGTAEDGNNFKGNPQAKKEWDEYCEDLFYDNSGDGDMGFTEVYWEDIDDDEILTALDFANDLAQRYNFELPDYSMDESFVGKGEGRATALSEFISTPEKEAAKKAFGKVDQNTAQAIEDGYYGLTDNLPNLINDLEKAAKEIQATPSYSADELKMIKNEAELYRKVQELIDKSVLGSIL